MSQPWQENSAGRLLKEGIARLRDAHVPSFTLTAELLLLHAIGRDRTWLYAHPEVQVSDSNVETFFSFLARRIAGEPAQYITGKQEFWGLVFEVTPDVLIPRPETEHVVEVALDRLAVREIRAGRQQTLTGDGLQIVDIGTGSGCIAIALAKELPAVRMVATDISNRALDVARRNAELHGFRSRLHFVCSNLFDDLNAATAKFDLIVSNPPYIGRKEKGSLMREVRDQEPEVALYGGEEGYEFYAELIAQAAEHLKPGGLLVLELGHNALAAVRPLLEPPQWSKAAVTNDLSGIARVIAAENTGASVANARRKA